MTSMTTSILISIRPKEIVRTINGEQTLLILKTVPKEWADYLSGKTKIKPEPMTAYMYCTKSKPYVAYVAGKTYTQGDSTGRGPADICFNSKVVAKFTLREVEKIRFSKLFGEYRTDKYEHITFCEKTCISGHLMHEYFKGKGGYALYVSGLVIFNESKELSNFGVLDETFYNLLTTTIERTYKAIKRAPQSWQYVEVLE